MEKKLILTKLGTNQKKNLWENYDGQHSPYKHENVLKIFLTYFN